jgi:hypothetical protein
LEKLLENGNGRFDCARRRAPAPKTVILERSEGPVISAFLQQRTSTKGFAIIEPRQVDRALSRMRYDGKKNRGFVAHYFPVGHYAEGIKSSSPGLPRLRGYPGKNPRRDPTLNGLNQRDGLQIVLVGSPKGDRGGAQ